jgi:cardiolipin synthase
VLTNAASTRILTVPNGVSFLRILGVFYFWWVLLAQDDLALAGWLIFAVGWTDWIDGYLARRLDQVSELGKALDPVADRLMIGSAVIGGLITGALPPVIGYPLIARELFMAVLTLLLVKKGGRRLEVRFLGKTATFILYGAIPAFFLADAGVWQPGMGILAWLAGSVGLVIYWAVAFGYVADARSTLSAVESPADN